MKCRDLMTAFPVCCLPADNSISIASMMKAEDVGSVPVLETKDSKKLIGIVTDRDLVMKVIAEGRTPASTKAKDIMTPNPITCYPENDLQTVLELMERNQVRRIPIVDDNGCLTGIISQADIAIRVQHPAETARVVGGISKPAIHAG